MRCYFVHCRWAYQGRTKSKWLLRQCKQAGHVFSPRENAFKRECVRCGLYQIRGMTGWISL